MVVATTLFKDSTYPRQLMRKAYEGHLPMMLMVLSGMWVWFKVIAPLDKR